MEAFDRGAEDVGNVLSMEHVNVTVPDQGLAALFYVSGMGFTRDPYIDFGLRNMWINVGAQQFHLPLGAPQVFRGRICVVVPDLDDLQRRLDRIGKAMADTRFEFSAAEDSVHVRCPWGNELRAFAPGRFARMPLGIPCVEVAIPAGSAAGVAAFYREVMGCPADAKDGRADVRVGHNQRLSFVETASDIPAYDGHHIAVYLANFSAPHRWLRERGLVTEESDRHQYRFQAIVNPESGQTLTELEHEVRSMAHPMFQRPLVNRNPAVGFTNYHPAQETFTPS